MLDRVMRRFGVSSSARSREPTYFESLLGDARDLVRERLAAPDSADASAVLTQALAEVEARKGRFELPELETPEAVARLVDYIHLLRDNDRQPSAGQLGREELGMARELMLAAGNGPASTGKVYEEVLLLLEEKFSGGLFAQASLLLRLFNTTSARQRSNEKTLFYEEMIARFGVMRVQRVPTNLIRRFHKALGSREDPAQRLTGAGRWLGETAHVRLHARRRDPEELLAWRDVLAGVPEDADDNLLDIIAPSRWRPVGEYESQSLIQGVRDHIERGALDDYVDRLLRATYFIVVVTTRTGFEPLIRDYFKWVDRQFRLPGARLLPRLHKWTTIDERGLGESVRELRAEFFQARLGELVDELDTERIKRAMAEMVKQLRLLDPNELPPGDYDLTGLLLDHMTGLSTFDPTVLFRVHRLC